MDGVYVTLLNRLLEEVKNEDIKKGINIALSAYKESGYMTYDDIYDDELIDETVKGYLETLEKEEKQWCITLDMKSDVIKCVAPNKTFLFPACVKKISTNSPLLREIKDTDIRYRDKTGEYMVGSFAYDAIYAEIRPGSEKDFLGEHRYYNNFFILARTAIALGILPSENSNGKDLVVGVDNEEIKEALLGEHRFQLKIGKKDWATYSFALTEKIIKVMEQQKIEKLLNLFIF